ncbi:MAG: hypothetical protein FJ117_20315 [Deltaproteobacteria bacterium]|nr:hypothetical protein [Deltaproteobacteria bacterium]
MEIKGTELRVGLYLADDFYEAPRKAWRYNQFFGKRIQILSFYIPWGRGNQSPDLAGIQEVLKSGFIPMITWEPWYCVQELPEGIRPEDQPKFSLSEILRGKYDDYIWQWAVDLKEISTPIFFRPMHEMNGNWYPWGGKVNGNRPEDYVEAWAYIRSIFRKAGNDKLIWVWSPYVHSSPDEPGNEIWRYFPGTQEVDWLGLDGYNWGETQEWSRWQSFQEVFEKGYGHLTQLAPEKPFMIGEVGCAEEGGDKSEWIEEAFGLLRGNFFQIKALVWFNIKKECDWRIESSKKSFISFRRNWSLC